MRCNTCTREFVTGSRHKRCPSCRRKIERKKDCPRCKVIRINKESKSCISCYDLKGKNNHNWKGGKTRHKAGYLMALCRDHPRAKNNNGYVFEHILVMEEILNRFLLDGENVHHRNGIKDDNRKSNLELWAKPQPSGIRINDKIDHAIEVLKTYAPNLLK